MQIGIFETAEEAFAVLFAPEADGEPLRLKLEKPQDSERDRTDSATIDTENSAESSLEKPKEAV